MTAPAWRSLDEETVAPRTNLIFVRDDGFLDFGEYAPSLRVRIAEDMQLDHATGCWIWPGKRSRRGYTDLSVRQRAFRTHRVAYAVFVEPFPNEALICHHCDSPPCCNPAHLFVGDHKANALDASIKGRLNTPGPRGESHPCATVSDIKAREAVDRWKRGESQRVIAADLGVSQGSVSNWIRGKTRPQLIGGDYGRMP